MSDGEKIVFVVLLDVGWCVYCGILSHLLRQSHRADAIATVLGCVIVAWMLR